MVNVIVSQADSSSTVIGGPTDINVSVDFGTQGIRGTYIFTGEGKPTDPDVVFAGLGGIVGPKINDLYINLKPSDDEYLYLYQYVSVNAVQTWVRILRLIPNTALANTPVPFYNGEAITYNSISLPIDEIDLSTVIPGLTAPSPAVDGMLWLDITTDPKLLKQYSSAISTWVPVGSVTTGVYFPLGAYFPLAELGTLNSSLFNIQYNILSNSPTSSGMTLGTITEVGSEQYLPIFVNTIEYKDLEWSPVTGIRTVHLFMTAGIGD